ncbi:O-antigen ligase family protein [Flavitalea flava]
MRNIVSFKKKISRRVLEFCEQTFLQKKLNNWLGYLFLLAVGLLFGYLTAIDLLAGMGLFGGILGLFVVIICLSDAQAGLYIIAAYSFFAFFINRLLFKGQMPVGILFDGMAIATFLGVFMRRIEYKENAAKFMKSRLVIFILFTLCYNAIEFFNPNSMSKETDILAIRKFLGYIAIFFTAYTVFDSYEKTRKYIFYLFILCTLTALYGCLQQVHGYFPFELDLILADQHGLALIFVNGEFRKFSTMSDPSSFGILMAVCAVFYLIIAINEKRPRTKWLMICGCVIMILAMGYSGTRTAYATAVGGLGFFIILNFDKKSTRVFGLVMGLVMVALLYGPFEGNKTIARFRTTFSGDKDESYKVRVLSRAFIQPYILSHPIGGGLGTTGATGYNTQPGHYLANFQPDSSYVMRAAETGWIGLLIVCILYSVTLITAIKAFFSAKDPKIKVLYMGIATSFFSFYIAEFAQVAIGGITDVLVYYPMVAIILKLKYYDHDAEKVLPA